MKTQSVKEGRETLHDDENTDGETCPGGEHEEEHDAAVVAVHLEPVNQDHLPEHIGEF